VIRIVNQQRNRECEKHVDAVEHDQQGDAALAPQEHRERRTAHQHDTVLGNQPARQLAELARHPGVGRHVGQHRGAAQEAGVGGDEQQAGLE
jgi:hypothetical protein